MTLNKPSGWEDWIGTVKQGDCLELMRQMPEGCVDLVLTDPPYNVGKDYGEGAAADRRLEYSSWLNDIWTECGRVTKDGGFLIYTNTTTFIPIGMKPRAPWRYFHLGCWNKPLSLRPSFYGICPHWEPIFILVKGEKPWRPARGEEIFNDVFSANVEFGSKETHPTIKPLNLWRPLITLGSRARDLILDPFMGSGTTAVACKQLGRRFIGFEINPKYVSICNQRLAQGVFDLTGPLVKSLKSEAVKKKNVPKVWGKGPQPLTPE